MWDGSRSLEFFHSGGGGRRDDDFQVGQARLERTDELGANSDLTHAYGMDPQRCRLVMACLNFESNRPNRCPNPRCQLPRRCILRK